MKAYKILLMVTMLSGATAMADSHDGKHNVKFGYRAALVSDMDDQDNWSEANEYDNTGMYFKTEYARVQFSGDINDKLSYKFRTRLNKDAASTNDDGLDNNVDYAYISHKLGGGKLVMGKQAIPLCGTEELWSSMDRYSNSSTCAASLKNEYNVGAAYVHKMGESKIKFYLGNGSNSHTTSAKESGTSFALGYYGDFGAFKPVFTYASFARPEVSGGADAHKDSQVALGLRYEMGAVLAELDYITFTDDDGTTDSSANSIVAHVRYTSGIWTPFAKIEMSNAEADDKTLLLNGASGPGNVTTAYDKKQGILVGADIKPWDKTDVSYYVFLQQDTYSNETSGATDKDYVDSQFQVGIKGSFGGAL